MTLLNNSAPVMPNADNLIDVSLTKLFQVLSCPSLSSPPHLYCSLAVHVHSLQAEAYLPQMEQIPGDETQMEGQDQARAEN